MNKDLKILELIDTFYPTVDGAINVVNYYAENLNEIASCSIAAPRPSKKSKYLDGASFKIFRCAATKAPDGYRNALPFLDFSFKKRIKNEHFDIYHTHSPFALGRFAVKAAKKAGVPVIATLHTKYHLDFERELHGNKPLIRFMMRYIMKTFNNADYVWTVSEASKQVLRDYGYKGEITVVRNGTEYVYPDNADELIELVNKKHSLDGQKNVWIFVGRMAAYKNLPMLCDALKILKDKGVDFKFIFVGGGFDLEKIKKHAETLDITDKCIFTGDIKDRSLLSGYFLRSELLVFPSTFDMASIAKIEAAAHKKATLTIEKSCSAEQIIDGENGFLCEETAISLADKLEKLSSKPELVKSVGENAHKTLYRTWADVAAEVAEKYREIITDYNSKHDKNN